ncbi:hypothetical protein RCL_jg13564.t1 [Rhizophagus clarus]|uniref:Uncharacterized protein n=1 Tax=Rhizophagus clarus TaxID=94130 RepID=A0A8H3QRS9_9GLOM|nr:hypothetical protein RCL_jg13564.t1 [Rhizophagus clarus]
MKTSFTNESGYPALFRVIQIFNLGNLILSQTIKNNDKLKKESKKVKKGTSLFAVSKVSRLCRSYTGNVE